MNKQKDNEFTKIAKYIHNESQEPIAEIIWLLKKHYNNDKTKLTSDYKDLL
tara:strand:+ start:1304 stop:1456 length:153 start_codon:yes stop_codon:yes gene_type:complete